MPPSPTFLLRTRWQLAVLRVQCGVLRLGLVLRAYNPGRPRVPAGTREGGRWSGGDGADDRADDARTTLVSDQDNRRYSVVLDGEEARGGHTLREHLGKTDEEMLQRVQHSAWWTIPGRGGIRRDGSLASREAANDLVNRTIEQNSDLVDQVATGRARRAFLTTRFGFKTGREAYSTEDGVTYIRDTYGVEIEIRQDSRSPRGYSVYTAYLRNDGDQNELIIGVQEIRASIYPRS